MSFSKLAIVLVASTTLAACHMTAGDDDKYAGKSGYHHHHGHKSAANFTDKFFAMMDGNADGTVTREERAAAAHQDMMWPFEKVDTNGDGVLTLEEYRKVIFELHHGPKTKPEQIEA